MISEVQLRDWITRFDIAIDEQADDLNKLDAALGDGDFGASMQRGFAAVVEAIEHLDNNSIGALLRTVGSTIVSSVGGTSGPLVGSLFLKAGISIGDRAECDLESFAAGLRAGADAVMALGGSAVGDKTMIDALIPALDALDNAAEHDFDVPAAIKAAVDAATEGADATRALSARRGRASYVGGGGIGCVDPGAQGIAILFQALAAAINA